MSHGLSQMQLENYLKQVNGFEYIRIPHRMPWKFDRFRLRWFQTPAGFAGPSSLVTAELRCASQAASSALKVPIKMGTD
jgi:hypothetical protein